MKIVFPDLLGPANETVSHTNVPRSGTPCQAGNWAVVGKCNIFEMLSNRLSITKIVMLTNKAVKDFFKTGSANGFKLDGEQISKRTQNRGFVNIYPGWFFSVCKWVWWDKFLRRQLDEAL